MPAAPTSRIPSDIVLDIGGSATPTAAPPASVVPSVVPPAQPPADLNSILQTLGAQTLAAQPQQAAPVATPAPVTSAQQPRGMQMDGSYKGKDVTIYSSTGDSRTADDFNTALAEYNRTDKMPSGFTVLEPGVMSTLRSGFETLRRPLRKAVEELDDPELPLNKLLPGFVSAVPKFLARQVNEQVKTPEKAGLFFGTMAAAPFLGPATTLAKGVNLPALGLNAAKSVVGAGVGMAAADVATGEPVDPGKMAVELGMVAASAGMQGIVSHVIMRNVPAEQQKAVTDTILKKITDTYPQLRNNPNAIDIYASSADNLVQLSQDVAGALRGNIDKVSSTIMNDLKQVLPTKIPVGVQNSYRKHIREFTEAGNDILNNINNPSALKAGYARYDTAVKELGDLTKNEVANFVKTQGGNAQSVLGVTKAVEATLRNHQSNIFNVKEGAQVLGYMREAFKDKGFDLMTMRNTLKDTYGSNSTQLLRDVREVLAGGRGQSLQQLPTLQERVPNPDAKLINLAKKYIPGAQHIPIAGTMKTNTPILPYQAPVNTPAVFNFGVQEAGQDAINSFLDRK